MKTFVLTYANGNREEVKAISWIHFYRQKMGAINVFGLLNIKMKGGRRNWA
jgi:hypothetical protein